MGGKSAHTHPTNAAVGMDGGSPLKTVEHDFSAALGIPIFQKSMAKAKKKARVREIKASPKLPVEPGEIHHISLTLRGSYWDAKCLTCGRGAMCGGGVGDAEAMLRRWVEWHASPNEFLEP